MRRTGGWRLAPVFDINPNPETWAARATAIAGAVEPVDEPGGLVELARRCRLSADEAGAIQGKISGAVAGWRRVARQRGLSSSEIDRFASIFEPAKQQ